MEIYIWDSYGSEEINGKIKYWVDLWEDFIEHFNKKSYGLELMNPHLLIRDIIDEIVFNRLQNKNNRKFFYKQLNIVMECDPVIKNNYYTDFALIRREFNAKRISYLLQLCKNIQEIFTSGSYFEECYNALRKILMKPNWGKNGTENIRIISQHLIVELLLKGYTLKTAKSFPRNIFDKYFIERDHVITNYPHNVKWSDFVREEKFDAKSYNEAVKAEIDSLTVSKRLGDFSRYYQRTPSEYFFIFRVDGVKGNVDFNIGDVNFYSPEGKKYVKKPSSEKEREFFWDTKNKYVVNAAVPVYTIDTESARLTAVETIERALDLIRCYYSPKANFEIVSGSYVVVDSKGRVIEESITVPEGKMVSWYDTFDLNRYKVDDKFSGELKDVGKFITVTGEKKSEIIQKIEFALHWYRKAEETNIVEDKLLNYWIAIETLTELKDSENIVVNEKGKESKYHIIRELLTPIQIFAFIYEVGWELYWYLNELLTSMHGDRRLLTLPKKLVKESSLNPKPRQQIDLWCFINKLEEINRSINRRIIKEKIVHVDKFYNDNSYARECIQSQMEKIKEDILLIYRYRNKIVHKAHYDNTVLPYYVQKARKYSGDLVRCILREHFVTKRNSVEEILLTKYAKMNRLIEKLVKNMKIDFLEINY
jgi:hypothetical protein